MNRERPKSEIEKHRADNWFYVPQDTWRRELCEIFQNLRRVFEKFQEDPNQLRFNPMLNLKNVIRGTSWFDNVCYFRIHETPYLLLLDILKIKRQQRDGILPR